MVRDIVISMGKCDGFAKLIVMAGRSLWRMIVMARVYCSYVQPSLVIHDCCCLYQYTT